MVMPLNGINTRPLTKHAIGVLRSLQLGPKPANEINAGVINRFQRGDLAEIVSLPSPYKTHQGRNTNYVKITQIGIDFLAALDGGNAHET